MFTGIVEGTGVVRAADAAGPAMVLRVEAAFDLGSAAAGDSIAVSGTCLTMTERRGRCFRVDIAPETMRRTTLGRLRPGDEVNLERPVVAGGRLGGHLVQGHVDGTGRVVGCQDEAGARWLEIEAPESVGRYATEKGSLAVDGVSLTVAARCGHRVRLCIIPYTLRATTLGRLRMGDAVNLEADIIAKYVERLLAPHRARAAEPVAGDGGARRPRGRRARPARRGAVR
jgi:riboflavin synthase